MSTFETEEKKRTTTYDVKVLKWLFGFIGPHKRFFILSLLLMILTAVLEISIPYLTKTAVDNYIYPSWSKASVSKKDPTLLKTKYKNSIINLNDGTYLIDLSKFGSTDKTDLVMSGTISKIKYVVINLNKIKKERKESLLNIFNSNKDIFKNKGNIYYTPFSNLENLSKKEVSVIRFEEIKDLKILVLFLFLSLIGIFVFTSSYTYLLYYSGHKIMHSIRTTSFSHILSLPQSFFDKNPVGRTTTRVTNDVNAINEVYTSVLVQFIKDMLVIVGIVVIMFGMNRILTVIILGLILFLGIVAALFRMKLKTVFRNLRITIGKLNAFVQESIRGIVLIKLYGRENQNLNRFKEVNRENYIANMSQLWAYVTFRPFIEYVSVLGTALILWYGGLNVIKLSLTLGSLIAFLYYLRMLFKPIQELSERYNIFQSAVAASENLYDIVNEKMEESGSKTISRSKATLEFKNVWFSYNHKDWVLKDVSFKVSPGETVALVGLTGSGKTTIVNLLLKFYPVQRGEILFNGINIDELENKSLRQNITAVFQDLFLFGKDISDEVLESDKVEEVFGLRQSLNKSNKLSSGEIQIVSLAKAFSKTASLLILDEATSHIDAEIERNIQRAIKEKSSAQAKLIIAHRLSNIRGADKIMVIHKGEIVEVGTHYDLLKNRGIYNTLHNFQKEVQRVSSTPIQ